MICRNHLPTPTPANPEETPDLKQRFTAESASPALFRRTSQRTSLLDFGDEARANLHREPTPRNLGNLSQHHHHYRRE